MGIQSTQDITRLEAIDRIITVNKFIKEHDYFNLEFWSFEPDGNIQNFIENFHPLDLSHIDKWTNKMLEDVLDQPYFRKSMFDNYFVGRNGD